MATVFGKWGPRHPRLAAAGSRLALRAADAVFSRAGLHRLDSDHGRERLDALRERLAAGGEAYLLGVGVAGHNTGASLVRASAERGLDLICNEEEERYSGVKHCADYPEHSVEAVKERMREVGIGPRDLHVCTASWDYAAFCALAARTILEEAPRSMAPQPQADVFNARHVAEARLAPARLGRQLGLGGALPIVGMRHHDNHAYFSYAVSPFARRPEPVMVSVVDGFGDDGTSSMYLAGPGGVELVRADRVSFNDSLGVSYGVLSSTQGGWPLLSSEGRYMGAAAWGDGNRLTNPYYRRLKHLFHFGPEGRVRLNRALANWTTSALGDPYTDELVEILGEPIPLERMWHPDAVLRVEEVGHAEITRERVDKAAAVQLVFEDGLVHVVDHLIRSTGSDRLVLTGGTALNCVANMRLLECFDEDWYERQLGRRTRLHIWVPPVPGDAGAPVGSAYAFAMRAGARPGEPLRHAFRCGLPPATETIRRALAADPEVGFAAVGDVSGADGREAVADLLAHAVAQDGVLGLYQGSAETGPRALGHRTIVANPTNPRTLELLNERVKFRERIRPLAPMVTMDAARRFFELEEGASDDDYDAYGYMVLTVRARPEAHDAIPAVVHEDGTSRIQIVRPDLDPFCHDFLLAMGRRAGVEVAVNTSLNVGAPIAHTPEQAIETLRRSRGMDGLLAIGAGGEALLAWLETRRDDFDARLARWLADWSAETGRALPALEAAPAGGAVG
ncbi:MAG TPA: carbamoyltransferase C-terminal domain-containing protein [Thermoleophilaceae bacterium]|jgi:carbamoyltransferase